MCGIVGALRLPIAAGVKALAHRGPDAQGEIEVGPFALGHTRLSIIDLDDRANQPFVFQGLTLVYNGELWNWKALKEELAALQGVVFTTQSDTEVVACALSQWGVDALSRFEGMFAMAWVPPGEAALYIARDRFGEVPLHYARQSDPSAPERFPEYNEDIDTEYCCPKCGYEWSGKPK